MCIFIETEKRNHLGSMIRVNSQNRKGSKSVPVSSFYHKRWILEQYEDRKYLSDSEFEFDDVPIKFGEEYIYSKLK